MMPLYLDTISYHSPRHQSAILPTWRSSLPLQPPLGASPPPFARFPSPRPPPPPFALHQRLPRPLLPTTPALESLNYPPWHLFPLDSNLARLRTTPDVPHTSTRCSRSKSSLVRPSGRSNSCICCRPTRARLSRRLRVRICGSMLQSCR